MKKLVLVFIIVMVSCSLSFAGDSKFKKKIVDAAGNVLDAGAIINNFTGGGELIDVASDLKDVAAVATTGAAVVGASGSGIMSTMATAGAAVGGGVVAGTATIAGVGGIGAASLMNKYVFDGDTKADNAAHYGTYSGAAAGTAGGIAAISAAGTAGLGAAGITSGLAGVGAAVGGGMAAGTVIVVAAPIVAAAAVGGAVYWLFSDSDEEDDK